ncbi:MAG: ATP synthase F0 subunit B, partial [Selenomonas sp.]|nr:ATP synthase F0 subunit B [Selenomonas sp.]
KNAEKRAAEFREAEEQKVKADIEQMKKSAQADIERDRAKAVEKLRTEMVALSMAAASKIIAKNMDSAENEALIAEFVDKLDKDKIGDLPC